MIKSLPSAVIFDWDNTLVDSWSAIAEAVNYTRNEFGLGTWSMDEIQSNCTRAARESFPDWFGQERWQEAYSVYYKCFDEVRRRVGIHKKSGADELLNLLKERNIPIFVVSNKRGDYLRQEAQTLKWDDYFTALIGATDAPRDKPARDPVDMALSYGKLTAGADIWFVGDSEADVACARNAECLPIFIGTHEMARQLKVDMSFSDCKHLQTLLYKYISTSTG